MEVVLGKTSEHEVRFISGKTVYVEALIEGQWLGRCWGTDGNVRPQIPPFAEPAFEIEIKADPATKTNTPLSSGWQWVSASEAPATERNNRHFVVELSNTTGPTGLKIHTLLDGTAVLTRWLQITNASHRPLALTAVAPWAGRLWHADAAIALGCSMSPTNQTLDELEAQGIIDVERHLNNQPEFVQHCRITGSFGWRSLEPGVTTIQTTREPCYDDPFFMLQNQSNGEYFFGQLAWPSIYRMEFDKQDGLAFRIGPIAPDGSVLRVIAPGETIATPAVHLCHLKGDFDATVQAMHDHIRRSVLPKREPEFSFRIEYGAGGDTGDAVYRGDDFNASNLLPCVDAAQAVGAELFHVNGPQWAQVSDDPRDDGMGGRQWIEGRKLMGWKWLEANKKLFPNGIRAVSDYAHEQGLLFGLYARTEGRNMLTTHAPGMFTTVCDMVDKHGLDLYGHDTSHDQWNQYGLDWVTSTSRDGFQECILWRHHDVFYRAVERIQEKYPNLILWQAHAGGARLDLATIGRWHENIQSDFTGVPLAYYMAAGFSVYLPPEVVKSAYYGMWGALPDKTTLKRCIYALGHAPAIYWTLVPAQVNENNRGEVEQWRKYAELFKTFMRPLLSTCKVYHHEPINAKGNWDSGFWLVLEFMAPDAAKGWAIIVSYPDSQSLTYQFRPKGLDEQKEYAVTFDSTGNTKTIAGSLLMDTGLAIEVTTEIRSELLLFEAQQSG